MATVADHIGSDFHQHLSPYGQPPVCHFFRQSVGHNFMLLTAAAAGIANFRCWLGSGGSGHRLATPELPPGADIRDRTSAFSDFRRLYPQRAGSQGGGAVGPKVTHSGHKTDGENRSWAVLAA